MKNRRRLTVGAQPGQGRSCGLRCRNHLAVMCGRSVGDCLAAEALDFGLGLSSLVGDVSRTCRCSVVRRGRLDLNGPVWFA
ncbi:hypothetical protein KDW74_gp63 [Mycobacterium phage Antsirabe]|uniref:Uncharacterized protein n=1 Tax=Mycobacterium phage Antsirabe TaxID=2575610 RepID=A0A5J6TGZ7_9CAUD|nr:hypothetical protein KDW74_gp63 [Mycobacterium phage Antsirabe]QFG10020.1 hypothetical protein PBI_ANTSIRABE_63 [Mycobacterium phage Antsirabe]